MLNVKERRSETVKMSSIRAVEGYRIPDHQRNKDVKEKTGNKRYESK